jgi:hypothetical protein
MPVITGSDRDQISFSSLETQIANDNEIRFNSTLLNLIYRQPIYCK